MTENKNTIELRKKSIEELLNRARVSLDEISANEKVASGIICVSECKGVPQYYYREEGMPVKSQRYLHASEIDLAKAIIQRQYLEKAISILEKNLRNLNHYSKSFDDSTLIDLFENLPKGRKSLITPLLPSNDQFVSDWLEKHKGGQNPYELSTSYLTDRGESVRTKSEKIIADLFNKQGIIYQYEPKIDFGRKVKYPDFAVLNLAKRKTYYWEHLGLTEDEDYAKKNFAKLEFYDRKGLVIGENLIVSYETDEHSLDINIINEKIRRYLL